MRRVVDPFRYEEHELALACAIVESVRADLESAGLTGRKLRSTTQSLAFAVASIYDGSAHVPVGDDHAVPVIGFAIGRMRNRLLLPEEGAGSSVHEFVPGAVKSAFQRIR